MSESHITTRLHNDQFVFLCATCGNLHRHGAMDGHRMSHCCAPLRFAGAAEGAVSYHIYDDGTAQPGKLTHQELLSVAQLMTRAAQDLTGIAELGSAAGIPELVEFAEIAARLRKCVQSPSDKRGWLELLSDMPPLDAEKAET